MNPLHKALYLLTGIILFSSVVPGFALEEDRALAKASLSFFKKNHFANYISLPLENDTNYHYNSRAGIFRLIPTLPQTGKRT